MKKTKLPRMDKTVFAVTTLFDESGDKQYWLSKTPLQRLEAVELMRQIIYGYDPATTRLSRVFEITQRA
ncbi:MAG: hypothetical protein HZB51_03935 [Chloroflexi bacterium]|nr:hypothetical protein [Chloroflexota bacterium]